MNDFRDLKAIAEACQQHQPLRFMPSHGALHIRNDNGIVFDVHQNRSFPEFMAQNKDYADLVIAANPAAVLALIAENERLETEVNRMTSIAYAVHGAFRMEAMAERDQLKAENLSLHQKLGMTQHDGDACITNRDALRTMLGLVPGQNLHEHVEALRKDAERYRRMRTMTLAQMDDTSDEFDSGFDSQLDAAMGKGDRP